MESKMKNPKFDALTLTHFGRLMQDISEKSGLNFQFTGINQQRIFFKKGGTHISIAPEDAIDYISNAFARGKLSFSWDKNSPLEDPAILVESEQKWSPNNEKS